VRVNRRLTELYGYAADEMLGASTRIMYPDDESFAVIGNEAYPEIGKGNTHHREQLMARKDGSLFWCHMIGRALDLSDPDRGTVWMMEDITERKKVEHPQ
jgi:two-component system sensor histidine kinase/response regulator